ncbi:MAG TPA: polyprenyl synthetase family protein, partial [Aliiroseovarius sp.]|nr:polyprenyl synthetase family protein [Aliiroseovarius sp.]
FNYGDALGVAFQIADDLLDFGTGADDIGKNTGDDLREGKLTLPLIRAISKASDDERAFWERVIARGKIEDGDFETARAMLVAHGPLESTRQSALDFAAQAKAALGALPDTPLRTMLGDLADYVVARLL